MSCSMVVKLVQKKEVNFMKALNYINQELVLQHNCASEFADGPAATLGRSCMSSNINPGRFSLERHFRRLDALNMQ